MTGPSPRRARTTFALAAAALVAAAVAVGWGVGEYRRTGAKAPAAVASKRGALLYQTSCASCHGPEGAGDGVSAAALKPPPRDFAARPWRFEPTRASIRQVILEGIPGTAMPAGKGTLADADVDFLVDHVHALATSRPPVTTERSPEETLVKTAGLVSLLGSDAPPFRLAEASGRTSTLADLRGKLVIIHFWGTACAHCLKEMPHFQNLQADYAGRGLAIVHVCADTDDAKQAQALLDKHAPGTRAWLDETGLGLARFEVQALPTVWLVAPDGQSIGRAVGAVDWRSPALLKLIERWLPKPAR